MGKSKRAHPAAVRPGTPNEAAEAYARTKKDIEALPADRVGRVTTDVPMAVSLALGALPQIEALLPEMSDLLKKPPTKAIEMLRDRALSLLHAHFAWAPPSTGALEADLEEARVLRERLLAAADAHVSYGQMDAAAIAAVREGAGHLDRAGDLIALAAMFQERWPHISEKTPATEEQIARASGLGTQLLATLGANKRGAASKEAKKAADRRNRAFRLLITDYEEIQRAVRYVRWHEGDADSFAPSLFNQQPRRKSADEGDDGDEGSGGGSGGGAGGEG